MPPPYLDSDEAIAAYLTDILQANDAGLLSAALGDIARARGMTDIAKAAGITMEALYKALRPAVRRASIRSTVCAPPSAFAWWFSRYIRLDASRRLAARGCFHQEGHRAAVTSASIACQRDSSLRGSSVKANQLPPPFAGGRLVPMAADRIAAEPALQQRTHSPMRHDRDRARGCVVIGAVDGLHRQHDALLRVDGTLPAADRRGGVGEEGVGHTFELAAAGSRSTSDRSRPMPRAPDTPHPHAPQIAAPSIAFC